MLTIKIICVGSLKEKYLKDMESEYLKRLSKYCKLEIVELKDEKLPTSLNDGNSYLIKEKEGHAILSKINPSNSYTFVMDEHGKEFDSIEFSKKISDVTIKGISVINFVIGGSLGLSEEVKKGGNELISFSRLTFPHQMIRIFLLEQLFRAFKIQNGERYHH